MIALDSRTKNKLIFAGVLLMPVIAVQGARFVLGPDASPAATLAAVPTPVPNVPGIPSSLVPAPIKAFTPAQQRAADWLASRASPASLRSPMDHSEPAAAPPVATRAPEPPRPPQGDDAPTPNAGEGSEPAARAAAAPRLTLTGLLVNGKSRLASINHRIFRVGDTVLPGWRLAAIDSKARSVTLLGPDGQRAVYQTPAPKLNELPPLTNDKDVGPLKPEPAAR